MLCHKVEGTAIAVTGAMIQAKLSKQEERIALLAITGCSDQQVAEELGLSLDTVRTYWKRIRKKMGGMSRAQIIAAISRAPVAEALEAAKVETSLLKAEVERRKEAEAALKASEARYRAIFEYTRDVVLIRNDEGIIVDINPSVTRILGYERDELIGKCYTILMPAGSEHQLRSNNEALATKGYWEGELGVLRKDGTTVRMTWKSVAQILPGQTLGIGRT